MKLRYILMLCGGLCRGRWITKKRANQIIQMAEVIERKGELIVPDIKGKKD